METNLSSHMIYKENLKFLLRTLWRGIPCRTDGLAKAFVEAVATQKSRESYLDGLIYPEQRLTSLLLTGAQVSGCRRFDGKTYLDGA